MAQTENACSKASCNVCKRPKHGKWIKGGILPHNVSTDFCCKFNEQQLIFAAPDTHTWNGLYLYNLSSQELKKFIKYPKNVTIFPYCLQFDASKNQFYGTGEFQEAMFIIDMNRGHKFTTWREFRSENNPLKGASCGTLLNVNGQLHLIGGWDNSKHLVFNEDSRDFSEIYDFKEKLNDVTNLSLIHVKSKKTILMIKEFDDADNDDKYKYKSVVWEYCLIARKWKQIKKLRFCHETGSPLLTCDERYVIMSDSLNAYIYVLDISNNNHEEYKLYESALEGPWNESHFLIKTGGLKDEILVIGWIKSLFQSVQFQSMEPPPVYLMRSIAAWYSQEEIHWIGKYTARHFIINIKQILSSLKKVTY